MSVTPVKQTIGFSDLKHEFSHFFLNQISIYKIKAIVDLSFFSSREFSTEEFEFNFFEELNKETGARDIPDDVSDDDFFDFFVDWFLKLVVEKGKKKKLKEFMNKESQKRMQYQQAQIKMRGSQTDPRVQNNFKGQMVKAFDRLIDLRF